MKSIATIQFHDPGTQDEVVIVLRADTGCVALGVSIKSDGDIEVVMPLANAQTFIRSLHEAIALAEKLS